MIKPKGKVVKDGQPLKLGPKGMLIVKLYADSDAEGAAPFGTDAKPDGTFEVIGKTREGVPPGKYRVAVEIIDPYPGKDQLGGRFSPKQTKLTKEIKDASEIVIDIGK